MPYQKTHDKVLLIHPKGATAEILLFGATVTSWKSAERSGPREPVERLFVSSKAVLDGSKAVRGGIPVVFPCFGPPEHPDHSKLPQHGFARNEFWAFDSVVTDDDAGVSVRLTLQPNSNIAKLYTKDFQLAYVVTLAEHELSTDIHVSNPSASEALDFQALLHTYIRAPANDVSISPLLGKLYIDKTEKSLGARNTLKEEKRSAVDVRTFTDSVYEDAPPRVDVSWPGGGVGLKLGGFTTLTVWNPQAEAGSKIGDMEENGWERFVCIEPGCVRGFKQLGAGETWIGQQVLVVV
ncbi:galactose mutarotase-like protein [Russula ochroleuca]|jgi:glucose-6-phosphate 1-epimerase|uniref:Glucose-6-phosphate 1-epimerase n=1 Tax=Russula ochroleuca TaxID=152965 RepID=A0A9P5MYK7_9AGAM|nr:galactose mutarotase-like protein [Russula ochroleuca]